MAERHEAGSGVARPNGAWAAVALGGMDFVVDLKRKLAPDDRLSGAIRLAMELNLPYDRILHSLVCGCHFRQVDEAGKMYPDDVDFVELYDTKGLLYILQTVCGFHETDHRDFFYNAKLADEIIVHSSGR